MVYFVINWCYCTFLLFAVDVIASIYRAYWCCVLFVLLFFLFVLFTMCSDCNDFHYQELVFVNEFITLIILLFVYNIQF